MAAPHAAGAIALSFSANPDAIGDVSYALNTLSATALDRVDASCDTSGGGDPNNVYGDGRLDANAAALAASDAGSLDVVVVDARNGALLPHARISATADGRTYSATTDATGRARLHMPPGVYQVTVDEVGHYPQTESAWISSDITTFKKFALLSRPSIASTITAVRDGNSVAGAIVTATSTTSGETFTATTDATGRAVLYVPAGTYRVLAEREGYVPDGKEGIIVLEGLATAADFALRTPLTMTLGDFVTSSRDYDSWVSGSRAIDATGSRVVFQEQTPTGLLTRVAYPPSGRLRTVEGVAADGCDSQDSFRDPALSWNGRFVVYTATDTLGSLVVCKLGPGQRYATAVLPGASSGKGAPTVDDNGNTYAPCEQGLCKNATLHFPGDVSQPSVAADGTIVAVDDAARIVLVRPTGESAVLFDAGSLGAYARVPFITRNGRYVTFALVQSDPITGWYWRAQFHLVDLQDPSLSVSPILSDYGQTAVEQSHFAPLFVNDDATIAAVGQIRTDIGPNTCGDTVVFGLPATHWDAVTLTLGMGTWDTHPCVGTHSSYASAAYFDASGSVTADEYRYSLDPAFWQVRLVGVTRQ